MPAHYKTMVDTENFFLGEMPSHWTVNRGAAFLYEKKIRNFGTASTNYLSLMANRGIILYEEKGDVGNKKPEDLSKCKVVEIGDFVLNSMNYAIGSYGVSPYNGVCSPVYVIMKNRPEKAEHAFVNYILSNKHYQTYAQSFGTGILDHRRAIGWDEIRQIPVALPPLEEQTAIARFLDRETGLIDGLIEKKTRFIALLKEKRAAVITHAVTKGIDPDAPLKDSGVDWLGRVPAHWEVVPPTALFSESKERAREGDQMLSATQKYGVIPLAEYEALEQRQVTMAVVNLDKRKHVELGDFVISMRSMDGGLERARAVGSVRSSYSVLKPGPDVEGCFYGALMKSSLYIQALRLTSNFIRDGQDLNFGHVRKVKLPKPDLREQAAIADHIEAETARIDCLLTLTERSIDLLREKRAALITAAVTGKIDVRAAA